MSEFLIIHYTPPTPSGSQSSLFYWALGGDLHPSITLGHGSLEDLTPIARGKKVSILMDAHFITLAAIEIPSKNRSKQLQAIPFAMEDLLAEDIENMHFALGKSNNEEKVSVIAITRDLLQQTLGFFKQHDIHIDALTADNIALPVADKEWSIVIDDDKALIKTSISESHSCDRDNTLVILRALLQQQETPPETIHYFYNADDSDAMKLLDDLEINIDHQTYKNNVLEIFVQNLKTIEYFNLLQGEFTVKREGNKWLQPWKSVASIVAVWMVLQLSYSGVLAKQLEIKNIELTRQIEMEFKRALPEARKMINMKKRVERHLKELKSGGSNSSEHSFLNLLSKASSALSKSDRLAINSAAYKNKYIDLDLTSKNLQDIEKIKSKLDSNAGLKTVLSTTVEKNSVKARLRLEAK